MEPPATPPADVDLDSYVGRYARESLELTFERDGAQLRATVKTSGPLSESIGADDRPPLKVLPVKQDVFVAKGPDDESWTVLP